VGPFYIGHQEPRKKCKGREILTLLLYHILGAQNLLKGNCNGIYFLDRTQEEKGHPPKRDLFGLETVLYRVNKGIFLKGSSFGLNVWMKYLSKGFFHVTGSLMGRDL